ncbi:MAG: ribonuclease PH [Coriobacteriales bacterium]|nr:ribonuclease PH [Coriobacteriales bacterium]
MSNRANDRLASELRPIKVTRGYLTHAPGSVIFELGETRVLCAATIDDSVPAWRRGSGQGWLTAEYAMLPAATHSRGRRETGGVKGRTQEIQRLIGRSLRTVVDLSGLGGEVTVTVDADVLQADGGTRTAAITGCYIAVYDALAWWKKAGKIPDIPLLDQIAATSVGMVDGEELLDLDYSEDSAAEIDMNVVMDGRDRFIEVQGTGERTPFDRERLDRMLDLAASGIRRLTEIQRTIIEEDLDVYHS